MISEGLLEIEIVFKPMDAFTLAILWFDYSNDGGAFGLQDLIHIKKENHISLRNVDCKQIHIFRFVAITITRTTLPRIHADFAIFEKVALA